jgi:hypothetical protein
MRAFPGPIRQQLLPNCRGVTGGDPWGDTRSWMTLAGQPSLASFPGGRARPVAGSAPRERGAHRRLGVGGVQHGVNPARERGARRESHRGAGTQGAGSTTPRTATERRRWDQPRADGEHTTSKPISRAAAGSAPRERGAHLGLPTYKAEVGISPRASGEHVPRADLVIPATGSAPRERGAPATAARSCGSTGDQPCASGEHVLGAHRAALRQGSAPRERGAHFFTWDVTRRGGSAGSVTTPRRWAGWVSATPENGCCRIGRGPP